MRYESNIRHQLRQVVFRHLQKRLKANFKQKPSTCSHNITMPLERGVAVGLCGVMSAEGVMRGSPCDLRIPGCHKMAKGCPLWEPLQTKDEVKADFNAIIQSGDRGVIASNFPDVAALLWVLDDDDDAIPSEDEIDVDARSHDPELSWGAKFFKKLGGG